MLANCGVGTYFCAITNVGDFRICNQSKMRFGNVLEKPIDQIWTDPLVDELYRTLKWVEEPCSSCPVLEECGGGCKVDEGCASGEFCIDRVVRGLSPELKLQLTETEIRHGEPTAEVPDGWRLFRPSRYLAVTDIYADRGDTFFKTRYQTIRIGTGEQALVESILEMGGTLDEEDFVRAYEDQVEPGELRQFVSRLAQVDAIEVVGSR
jgi:radical SAM protein with 4Fe4S-binding SPASM domain